MKRKLGEICRIVSGSTPKTGIPEYWDGNLKWITPAELDDKSRTVNDTKRTITELGAIKTGLTPLPAGTVLLSSRAPIGKVAITGCEMYCNQGFKNLICSDLINNEYLYWFLKGKTQCLKSLGRGATFKEISKTIVADIEINLPDIEEQEKIVNCIKKIDSRLFMLRAEISRLDELIKARFVEMFKDEDPVFAFDDVLIDDTKNGFKLDSSNYSNLGKIDIVDQGQKRICGYINAVDGKAPWSKEAIIFGDHTEMFKYINFPFYLGADGTKLLSPKNGWNTRFLYHYLDINYHKRLGYMRHFKYLKEMSFIKPDLDRQEEFCMFCTQVDKSKFALQNNIISLMNLWYNINQYVCERTYGEA